MADFPFEKLQAGMRFHHPKYGNQVILDLGRGRLGPIIVFNDCDLYSGHLPISVSDTGDDEEDDLFHRLARTTYPTGVSEWEYLDILTDKEIANYGWFWYMVACPHCAFIHKFLVVQSPNKSLPERTCRVLMPLLLPHLLLFLLQIDSSASQRVRKQ